MKSPQVGVDYPGSWKDFVAWFADEGACRKFLEGLRWRDGFRCPNCSATRAWPTRDGRWSCSGCSRKVSVTAGTVFDRTRQPLQTWFAAMWYLTNQKNGVSALGLQRILGLSSYQTAWSMLHKLRSAMIRPGREKLSGEVEIDETYVGGVAHGGKRGRGAASKTLVVVAVEVHAPRGFGRTRMRVVPDASADSLIPFVRDVVALGSAVLTDGWPSYPQLTKHGYNHKVTVHSNSGDPAHVSMPAVHRIAALLKRWILGTLQGSADPVHLQAYLEEFSFRFNRRRSRRRGLLFYRLAEQAVVAGPLPYRDIVAGASSTTSRGYCT